MSQVVIRDEKHTRRLPCRLTSVEKSERLLDLAGALAELAEAQLRWEMRKADTKTAKVHVDEQLGRMQTLSGVINSNQETRAVECETLLDYAERQVIARRLDTGAVVTVRAMDVQEAQGQLYESGESIDPEDVRLAVEAYLNRGGEPLVLPEAEDEADQQPSAEAASDPTPATLPTDEAPEPGAKPEWMTAKLGSVDLGKLRELAEQAVGGIPGESWSTKQKKTCVEAIEGARRDWADSSVLNRDDGQAEHGKKKSP